MVQYTKVVLYGTNITFFYKYDIMNYVSIAS